MYSLRSRIYSRTFQRLPALNFIPARTAIIPSRTTAHKRKRRIKDVSASDLNLKGVGKTDTKTLEFKLKQLQEFTRNIREQIKLSESNRKKNDELNNQIGPSEDNDDQNSSAVFNELIASASSPTTSKDPKNLSSIIMAAQPKESNKLLPDIIRKRINDDAFVLASLVDKSHQNWNGIISKLHNSELQLKEVPIMVLKKWLLAKCDWLSFENIENLDQMLLERVDGDISRFSYPMYNCLFSNLSKLKAGQDHERIFEKMKELLQRYDQTRETHTTEVFEMNQFILNCCIKYSSKALSFENMNYFLSKFKEDYGITPNRQNYTTIIQFYTKIGVSKQAWDVFDTMKFLSKSHEPDVVTYNSVLHLCNRDRDYARAIDLFQEMSDKNVQPNAQTLNIMAKTLARASADSMTSENKAESLRLLGWKYIHQIEDTFHTKHTEVPFYHTLEAMMALAAYDGDVGLARALYYKYTTQRYRQLVKKLTYSSDIRKVWQYALDPRLFNYLLLAYSKFDSSSLPILMGYEQGIKLRRNIMNSVDYTVRQSGDDGINNQLPMLPVVDLNQPWQVLAESRALWQFNLEYGGLYDLRQRPHDLTQENLENIRLGSNTLEEFKLKILHKIAQWKSKEVNHAVLNPVSLTSFLTIPIRLGDEKEFLLRFETFCFQQQEFDSVIEQLYNGFLQIDKGSHPVSDHIKDISVDSEDDSNAKMAYIASMKHKILASCATYELMMKAAATFGDSKLATKAWKYRGDFRKTLAFKNLNIAEKNQRDREFAALMVSFFANQGMYADALGIIMTSQRFIDWKYDMVRALHQGLIKIEDEKSAKILLEIVNKKSPILNIEEHIKELNF